MERELQLNFQLNMYAPDTISNKNLGENVYVGNGTAIPAKKTVFLKKKSKGAEEWQNMKRNPLN